MTDSANLKLAVLIDADNAQASIVEGLLAEIAKYGTAHVKRIYGDWTLPDLGGWKETLLRYSIQPIQQFRYTRGKNATDGAMMIDAMDLLYARHFDGFCLVSSDSDFTRLASRLRESGMVVYGFGEQKTPEPFVAACDKFVYTEVLRADAVNDDASRKSTNELKGDTRLVKLLRTALDSVCDDTGWAALSAFGSAIAKRSPDFDARNYGYDKLSELVKSSQLFEVEARTVGRGPHKAFYVRDLKSITASNPKSLLALIDTHCHIDVEAFDADRSVVLRDAREAGLTDIVVPAIDANGWDALLSLCTAAQDDWPRLHPALGLHPLYLDRHQRADLARLEQLLAKCQLGAIGEIGLDYADPDSDHEAQRQLFAAQLSIARAADLPVLLHVRKAHDEVLALLKQHPVRGGIAHAFSGSLEQGKRYLDLGFKLGFGGMLTFARSNKLRRLAEQLPLEALVLETDAPDMTVASHHGERNSPAYLPEVLAALAEVRELDPHEIAARTSANAREVLGWMN